MSDDLIINFTGTLGADPTIRHLQSGATVAEFSIAGRERRKGADGNWEDADASWVDCKVWGQMAEHVVETCVKGTRVTGTGKLKQEKWETDSGDKRSKHVIVVESIGPDLRFATAKVEKMQSGAGSSSSNRSSGQARQQPAPSNPYA